MYSLIRNTALLLTIFSFNARAQPDGHKTTVEAVLMNPDPASFALPEDAPTWQVNAESVNSDMWKAEEEVMKKYGVKAAKVIAEENRNQLDEVFAHNEAVIAMIKATNPTLTREILAAEKMSYAKTQSMIESKMTKYFQKKLGYQPTQCDVDWLPINGNGTDYNVKVWSCTPKGKRNKIVCNLNINTQQNLILADLMKKKTSREKS